MTTRCDELPMVRLFVAAGNVGGRARTRIGELARAALQLQKDSHALAGGHPVRRGLSADQPGLWNTGSPAFAGDDSGRGRLDSLGAIVRYAAARNSPSSRRLAARSASRALRNTWPSRALKRCVAAKKR